MSILDLNLFEVCFEDDAAVADVTPEVKVPVSPEPVTPTTPATDGGKLFTQEQANAFAAEARRKAESQLEELSTRLNDIMDIKTTTEEKAQKLESMQADLRAQLATKDREVTDKVNQTKAEYEAELSTYKTQLQTLKSEMRDKEIMSVLLAAAREADAANPDLFVAALKGKDAIKYNEEDKSILIHFEGRDAEGNRTTEVAAPKDAVARMRDLPDYGHQFKSNLRPGIGGTNTGDGGSQLTMEKLAKLPYAEYIKLVDENPNLIKDLFKNA